MLTFIPTATSDPFLDSVPPKTSRTLEQPRATLGNVFNRKILLCIPSKENPCECHSSKWPFHPITSNHLFHFYFWMYFFSCNAGILCCIWGILSLSRTIIDHFFFPSLKEWKALKIAWTSSSSISFHLIHVFVACITSLPCIDPARGLPLKNGHSDLFSSLNHYFIHQLSRLYAFFILSHVRVACALQDHLKAC